METKDLVMLTHKRISGLTEVEFKHSVDCSDDYPLYMKELLDSIHTGDDRRIGAALKLFLYTQNQFDIQLHEGL